MSSADDQNQPQVMPATVIGPPEEGDEDENPLEGVIQLPDSPTFESIEADVCQSTFPSLTLPAFISYRPISLMSYVHRIIKRFHTYVFTSLTITLCLIRPPQISNQTRPSATENCRTSALSLSLKTCQENYLLTQRVASRIPRR
jgi:hypothetical protein